MDDYINNLNSTSVRKNDYKLANSYDIKDFDPMEVSEDITGGIIAIISPTGTGKTVLLKDILSKIGKNYKTSQINLFSRTAKLQECYDFFPRGQLYDDYDEEIMTKIWNKQTEDHDKNKKTEPRLIILDDVIASPNYIRSKIINEMAFGARHLNILIILLSQYMVSIKACVRNNIRIAFAFQLSSKREREKFIEQFLATETNGSGDMLYKKITGEKYQCIVVSNYKAGEAVENRVKKYTADPKAQVKFKKEPKEKSILLGSEQFKIYKGENTNQPVDYEPNNLDHIIF